MSRKEYCDICGEELNIIEEEYCLIGSSYLVCPDCMREYNNNIRVCDNCDALIFEVSNESDSWDNLCPECRKAYNKSYLEK